MITILVFTSAGWPRRRLGMCKYPKDYAQTSTTSESILKGQGQGNGQAHVTEPNHKTQDSREEKGAISLHRVCPLPRGSRGTNYEYVTVYLRSLVSGVFCLYTEEEMSNIPPSTQYQNLKRGERKLMVGLELAAETSKELTSVFQRMTDIQRKVFMQIATGKDSLEAAVITKQYHWFNGIVKYSRYKDGTGLKTEEITSLDTLHELDDESYQRLLRLTDTIVSQYCNTKDWRETIPDIADFFKLLAPEALTVVSELMQDAKVSPSVRLSAAKTILDKAGYNDPKDPLGSEGPLELHFNFAGTKVEAELLNAK